MEAGQRRGKLPAKAFSEMLEGATIAAIVTRATAKRGIVRRERSGEVEEVERTRQKWVDYLQKLGAVGDPLIGRRLGSWEFVRGLAMTVRHCCARVKTASISTRKKMYTSSDSQLPSTVCRAGGYPLALIHTAGVSLQRLAPVAQKPIAVNHLLPT